jgi:hypothetical protein
MADVRTDDEQPAGGGGSSPIDSAAWKEFASLVNPLDEGSDSGDQTPPGGHPADDGAERVPDATETAERWTQPDEGRSADTSQDGGDNAPGKDEGEADPWATAPEDLRNQYRSAAAERDDLRRRHSGNTRKIQELQDQVRELTRQQNSPPKKEGGEAGQQPGDDGWKRFKEDYPDIAEPMEARTMALQKQVESLERQLGDRSEQDLKDAYDRNYAALIEQHADFDAITASKPFADWLGQQPRYVIEAAVRNGEDIVDLVETLDIVDRFKAHAGIGAAKPAESRSEEGAETRQTDPAAKRNRQLAAADTTPGRNTGPAMASGVPEGATESWKHWSSEQRAGRL